MAFLWSCSSDDWNNYGALITALKTMITEGREVAALTEGREVAALTENREIARWFLLCFTTTKLDCCSREIGPWERLSSQMQ